MRTKGVWLLILYRAVLVMAIQCPMDYRPYTCSSAACSCLLVSTETEADFPLALTTCSDSSDGGHLALIGEDYDRQIIQRYVEVLAGDSSNLYWVGYRYDSSVAAVDVNGQPALSVLTNTSNFDPSTPAPSTDSCIAIGGDGLFRNVPCDTALQYICSVDYTAPAAIASSNPARFVPSGDPVTLSCSLSGDAISKSAWFFNEVEITDAEAGFTLTSDASMLALDISQFDGSFEGNYHCRVENPFGTALSQVVPLEEGDGSAETPPTINTLTVNTDLDNTAVRTIALGEPIILACEADDSVTFSWFRNGEELTQSSDSVVITNMVGTTSMLEISSFQESGVYQCRVETTTGYHAVDNIALGATDGTPGPIDSLFASPRSQSEVIVGWLAPEVPNTQDLLLLRYRVLYSTDPSALDSSTPPLLPSAGDDAEQTTLRDLDLGTKYTVSLVSSSLTGEGMLSQFRASATTYGTVPTGRVTISSVERTPDNQTLVVVWETLVTSLPTGDIATYEIEYRDAGQITSNSGVVPGGLNFFILSGLANANDYEVRVRACIEIRDEPVLFSCTEWSDYTSVEGITTNVPPTQGIRNNDDVAVIVPAVVVPVTVLIVLIVLVALYFCYVSKRSGKMEVSSGGRGRTESSVGLTSSRAGDAEKPPSSMTSAI